jgi:hypothetical protein
LGSGALVADDAGKVTTTELKDVSQITDDELFLVAPPPAYSKGLWWWAHKGKLLHRSFGWHKGGEYLYRYADGRLVRIEGSVEESSAMLATELDSAEAADRFVKGILPNILLSFLSRPGTDFIDQREVDLWEKENGGWNDVRDESWTEDDFARLKRSPAIYRKYLSTPQAVVEDGKWRVDFNVSLRDGSIERWTGEGTVFPFAIVRLDRAQLEKPGTVMEAFVVE